MKATSAALMISIALVIFGITYYFFTTRHKERMAIIENGLPADHFEKQGHFRKFMLALGMLSTGIALGILIGMLLVPLFSFPAVYIISFSVFLFTGISLIISYMILDELERRRK